MYQPPFTKDPQHPYLSTPQLSCVNQFFHCVTFGPLLLPYYASLKSQIWYWDGNIPGGVHVLLGALCLGITPDKVKEPYVVPGIETWLAVCKNSTLPITLVLRSHQLQSFLPYHSAAWEHRNKLLAFWGSSKGFPLRTLTPFMRALFFWPKSITFRGKCGEGMWGFNMNMPGYI